MHSAAWEEKRGLGGLTRILHLPWEWCKVKSPSHKAKTKTKSIGQECPIHTSTAETSSRLGIAATHPFAKKERMGQPAATTQQMRGSHKNSLQTDFRSSPIPLFQDE